MPVILINLLKNPAVLIGISAVAIIGYLYMSNMSLEKTVLKREVTIAELTSNNKTLKANNAICNDANTINLSSLADYKADLNKTREYYERRDSEKLKIIKRLRKEIRDLKIPVKYTKTVVYEKCKVHKKIKDRNGNKTLSIISNIGN